MEDLNAGISDPDALMLGGGNPANIPALQQEFKQVLQKMVDDDSLCRAMGNYDGPQGHDGFRAVLADYLAQRCGWQISADNIALTNGSQNAFFYLFNIFAGEYADNTNGKILLPLAPEYIGYCDAPISPDAFCAAQPEISITNSGFFKYSLDRGAIEKILSTENIKAICASRPTNPSGNMLTDAEVDYLYQLARSADIPLILDYAYGAPFPGIVFTEQKPFYAPGCIACLSLSKLGLPGTRCGIVVADAEIITLINRLNGVINLAPGGIGASVGKELILQGKLDQLCRQQVKPFYRAKIDYCVQALRARLSADELRIHQPEGGFFLWLWFPQLNISSFELYQRLKAEKLIVVSGHYFFPGLEVDWPHSQQCLRINVARDQQSIDQASSILERCLLEKAS